MKRFETKHVDKKKTYKDKQAISACDNAAICNKNFPSTRYQGSKRKILEWIDFHTKGITFDTVLDAFGGTGSVGYVFKQQGKQVFYNDYLQFNTIIGRVLIENNDVILDENDVKTVLTRHQQATYPSFIFDNFSDIYFTDE